MLYCLRADFVLGVWTPEADFVHFNHMLVVKKRQPTLGQPHFSGTHPDGVIKVDRTIITVWSNRNAMCTDGRIRLPI